MNKTERQSNLELLRIVAMFLIVMHHYSIHGGGSSLILSSNFNNIWCEFLGLWGKVGVNLFVLITGYFLIRSTPKISSIIRLWGATLFYSVVLYILFISLGKQFNISQFIKTLFPLTFNQYWFISCYVALMVLVPFLNLGLRHFNQNHWICLISVLAILWSLIPTLFLHPSLHGNKWYFSNLGWFIYLYLIAGYFRLYPPSLKLLPTKRVLILLSTSIIVILSWVIWCNFQYSSGNTLWKNWRYFSNMNNVFVLIVSLSIFFMFLRLNLGYNKWINMVASCMLGVYLIHDNRLVRPWLWQKIWDVKGALSLAEINFITWSFIAISVTFFLCTAVEFCRKSLFKRFSTYIQHRFNSVDLKVKKIFDPNC